MRSIIEKKNLFFTSNSQTFLKYLSSVSTSKCMNSSMDNSFSSESHPTMKNNDAYLLYTNLKDLYSMNEHLKKKKFQ